MTPVILITYMLRITKISQFTWERNSRIVLITKYLTIVFSCSHSELTLQWCKSRWRTLQGWAHHMPYYTQYQQCISSTSHWLACKEAIKIDQDFSQGKNTFCRPLKCLRQYHYSPFSQGSVYNDIYFPVSVRKDTHRFESKRLYIWKNPFKTNE